MLHSIWALFKLGSSAAIFGILLLLAFVLTHYWDWSSVGIYRYDVLLAYAVLIQFFLVYAKLETPREVLVIAVFHVMAMVMELFLTHPNIASWQYPENAVFRIATVPLFAGFMYSAVGSFLARSVRLLQVSLWQLPPLPWLFVFALLAYGNFFSKFFVPDIRMLLFVVSVLLFWRTKMQCVLLCKTYQVPFLPVLLLLALLVWLAENIATFAHIWRYPSQLEQWHWVGWGKFGSWYLLLSLSLVLVLMVMGRRNAAGQWCLTEQSASCNKHNIL